MIFLYYGSFINTLSHERQTGIFTVESSGIELLAKASTKLADYEAGDHGEDCAGLWQLLRNADGFSCPVCVKRLGTFRMFGQRGPSVCRSTSCEYNAKMLPMLPYKVSTINLGRCRCSNVSVACQKLGLAVSLI